MTNINTLKTMAVLKAFNMPYHYDSKKRKYVDDDGDDIQKYQVYASNVFTPKELFAAFSENLPERMQYINDIREDINFIKLDWSSYEDLFTDKFFGCVPFNRKNVVSTILLNGNINSDDKSKILRGLILDFQSFKRALFKIKVVREVVIGDFNIKEHKLILTDTRDNNKRYVFYAYFVRGISLT